MNIFVVKNADFRSHLREFTGAINEIARARPHEGMDGQRDGCADWSDQVETWRQAAKFERGAKLEAVGASAFGGTGTFEGGDGDFEQDWFRHGDGGSLFALRKYDVACEHEAHGATEHNVAREVIAARSA